MIRLRVVPKRNFIFYKFKNHNFLPKKIPFCTAFKNRPETKIDSGHAPNDPINITTSTPTPGRMVTHLGGAAHATHARHHLMAKDSNPKFEFLNDSAWDRRNIEAFYMKQS